VDLTPTKRILFLNPPSLDGRRINRHIMDPHVSKGHYLYPPYDFLLLSGLFKPNPHFELKILDAMALNLGEKETLESVAEWKPDFILAMSAPQCHNLDMAFLKKIKLQVACPLFTAGAVQHSRKKQVLENNEWMDGILLEPVNDDLLKFIEGQSGPWEQLITRKTDYSSRPKPEKTFELPMPRHDLINPKLYTYPSMITDRFTSVLASYSCPYTCEYCEAPSFKYKLRSPDSVIKELRFIHSLGIREVCFKDWTFGVSPHETEELLDHMIEENFGISWFTFTRAEVLNQNLIRKMKKAGCRVLQIGVETVELDALKNLKRKNDLDQIKNIFHLCRMENVATMATLVLGLPGCDEDSFQKTIDYVIEIDPDYASFNIITPLIGSKLRAEWESQGLVDSEIYENQDSTRAIANLGFEPERLVQWRDHAVRRFYFRPKYILRRLKTCLTWNQMLNETQTGWYLFVQHVLKRSTNPKAR
jgi:anaerobic magnesium-protoporphyrin IX monomethyl ester cyclase